MSGFPLVVTTILLLCAATPARADLTGNVNVLSVWARKPGSYSDGAQAGKNKNVTLDPYKAAHRLEIRKIRDPHYGETKVYRGVPLSALAKTEASRGKDRALFHFANGMIIPLDLVQLRKSDGFLALEICNAKGKDCTVDFPGAPRTDVYAIDEDPNPIAFSWNKVAMPSADDRGFSPWRHADTLIGVEFVDGQAYDAQFAIGSSGGQRVFLERCQFCHGARKVGATFGWDFVDPLPLHEKRDPANLLNHVKYPKAMAQRLGLQMPPQKDVDASSIQELWSWMRDVAKTKVKPYRP